MVNQEKIRDKVQIIKNNLSKLESIKQTGLKEFLDDLFMSDAAIRQLQVSIEAMLDISHPIVSRKHLGTSKTYRETIELLAQAGIIPQQQLPTHLVKRFMALSEIIFLISIISSVPCL